jgi:hypothetical protein
MIYAATSVWLAAAVLLAWGVYEIWAGMLKVKALNMILWPGTMMAQLGRVIAILITGGTFEGKQSSDGEEEPDPMPNSKVPLIGPMLMGLLPMVIVSTGVVVLAVRFGSEVLAKIPPEKMLPALPLTWPDFWAQLRGLLSLAEAVWDAIRTCDAPGWETAAFAYLLMCLCVRLAPFRGNLRGHLGALLAIGITTTLLGTVTPGLPQLILAGWPMLSLTVGWLVLLLLFSLVVRGTTMTFQRCIRGQ